MAIGAITTTEQTPTNGPQRMDAISFAGDGAYPTGGTAAFQTTLRAALGVGNVDVVAVIPIDCGGYVPAWDNATGKLKVYHGNNDGGADGPLVEVPNATDLSAVTFKVLVVSK